MMIWNIDTVIFIAFLAVNLIAGLFCARGTKTLSEYAIGNRNFTTAALAATIIATCIGGGTLSRTVAETYHQGLYYLIPFMADPLAWLIIGYFVAPRMAEFLGKLSVAEAIGSVYGKNVRIVCAIVALISCIGIVAGQFKVSATVLKVIFNISSFHAVLASAIIVILYSTFGGIKAVAFTDIIQFFTFASVIPILSLIMWGTFDDPSTVFSTISNSELFDLSVVFDLSNPRLPNMVLLFLFFMIPLLEPAYFQRMVMARNTEQIKKSFTIAAFGFLGFGIVVAWIGILLLSHDQNLEPNDLLAYIIENYSYPGLKGCIAIGVLAIIMSTADSFINSAAVMFTNDICIPLGVKIRQTNFLTLARTSALCIGVLAFILAFYIPTMLKLLLLVWGYYMAVLTAPLWLAILGFRSTPLSAFIGIVAGITTTIAFELLKLPIDAAVPGMCANAIGLIGSHYLLKQKGGWVGIKDKSGLIEAKAMRKLQRQRLIETVKNFDILKFCRNNAPKEDYIYSLAAVFCLISVCAVMYSMSYSLRLEHSELVKIIEHTTTFISAMFLCYPVWPATFKREGLIAVLWNLTIPYMLISVPILLILISNFGHFQLMVLAVNLLIIASITRWQATLLFMIAGIISAVIYANTYLALSVITFASIQFKISYLLLLVSSILIVFIKPKQEKEIFIEQKSEHLAERISTNEVELTKATQLKYEFLRNLEHEAVTPITGITSIAQDLYEAYDRLTDQERRETVKLIAGSAERLTSLVRDMVNLSKLLNKFDRELHKKNINLSRLLHDRIGICKKLYLNGKEQEFSIIHIDEKIMANCDEYYMSTTFDNLIINAIQYSRAGKILISLKTVYDRVEFSISDDGIAIAPHELYDIFEPFMVSSKTRTPAGGRGIGLALCHKVIELHNGKIRAISDGKKGATFIFDIPIK